MDNVYTIDEIIAWYANNSNFNLTVAMVNGLTDKKIIKKDSNNLYSLDEINNLLLDKVGEKFITNNDGKFCIKNNRLAQLSSFKENDIIEPPMIPIEEITIGKSNENVEDDKIQLTQQKIRLIKDANGKIKIVRE